MKIRRFVKKHDDLLLVYAILVVVFFFGAVSSKSFLTGTNMGNILEQAVSLGIVSLGQILVILIAGIDLSVGAVVSMSTAIMSLELLPGIGGLLVNLLLTIGAGVIVGLFNGIGIVRLRIPPFIMTLASMSIVSGIALKIRPIPGGTVPYEFMDFMFGRIGIFPRAVLLWAIAAASLFWLLERRRFGRNLYAVGDNAGTAVLSGIKVDRVRLQTHVLCSVIAAGGGICVAARMGTGDAKLGELFSMDSVTVCVLGGVSLFGGQGNVIPLLAAVFIVSGISNILNMLGVSSYYQYIFKGFILLMTVLVFSIKNKREG